MLNTATGIVNELHKSVDRSNALVLFTNFRQSVIALHIAKQNGFEEVRTQEAERVVQNTGSYDFNSENAPEVYTVQIAATKLGRNIISFDKLDNVFHHKYVNDGYTRYYSGQFQTKAEANRYKKEVLSKGFKGSFVIKLKGDKRIY